MRPTQRRKQAASEVGHTQQRRATNIAKTENEELWIRWLFFPVRPRQVECVANVANTESLMEL